MSNYLFGLCNPKRNITAFTNPPARVELQNNPYSIEIPDPLNRTQTRLITQYDLNMRRKVEILKYNSTKVSTQTNSLTKSQKWSNVVSNKSSYVVGSSSSKLIHKSTIDCPGKPTPSNHSDIPGDVIMLYQNDDVPLYNYNVDMFSHSVLPPSTLKDWLNDFGTNVYIYDSAFLMKSKYLIYSTVSNIFIQNVDTTYYSYSLTTPVAFTFSGSYTPPEEATITLHIEELYLTIYYNGSIVGNKIYPNKQQFQNTNYIFKISQTSTNTNKIGFKATVFLTNLRWDCIKLINKSNFTYSLNLNVSYTLTSSTNVVLDPANNINYNGNFMQSSSHYFIANFITTENLMDITNDLNIDVISDEVIPEYSIYSLIENNICAKYPVLISYISDLNDNSNVFFTISYSLDINANKYNALIQPLPLENSLVIVVDNNHNFIVKSSSSSVPAFLYNTIYTININAVYDNFITDYSNPIRCIYLTPPILLNKQVSFLYNNVNFIFVNTTIYDPKVSFFANITDVFDNNTVITSPTILSSFMFRSENNIKVTQQDTTPDATTVFFKNKLYNVKIRAGYNNKYSDYSLVQSCIYLSTPFLLEPTVNGNESFIIPFKVDSSFPYPAETTYTATVTQLNGDPLPLPFVESSIIVVNKNHNFIVDLSYSVEPAFVYNIPYNQPYYVEINAIYDDFITAYSRPVICIYLTPPILQKKNVIFISNNIMFIFFNTTIYDENVTFFANITDVFDNNTVITSPINVLSQSVRNGNILNVTPTTGFSKNNLYNVKIRAEYNSIYSDYSLVQSCIYLPTPVLLEPTVNGNQSFIIPFTIDSSFPYPGGTVYTATVTQLNGDYLSFSFVELIVVNNNFIVDFSYSDDPALLSNRQYNVAINAAYNDFITDYSNSIICIYLIPPSLTQCFPKMDANNQLQLSITQTITYHDNIEFSQTIFNTSTNSFIPTEEYDALYEPVISNQLILSSIYPHSTQLFTYFILYKITMIAFYNRIVAVSNEISYVFVAPPTNLQYNRFGKYFTFNLPILDPLYPLSSPAYNTYINEGLNSSFDFDSITNYIPLLTDNITTNFNDGLKTGTYIVTSCDGSENAYNAFTSDGFSIENLTSYTTTVDLSNIDGAWTQIKLPIPIQMTSFTVDFLDRPAPVQIKIVASNDGSIWTNYATSNNDDIITVNTIGSPTVYTLGSIIFYKFTTGGKITLSDTLSGKILIVGGGGGGGTTYVPSIEGQGGGGAGQMVFGNINLIGSSEYTVTIGEGAPSNNMGSDSSVTGTGLNNYIAIGGGKGGSSGNSLKYGGIGGSGGGSSGYFGDARGGAYRSRTNTADLTYYGNNGGDGILYTGGGGGGGAKESGSTSNNNKGGAGGNGKLWIDGNTYAGGGGGGGSKYQDIYNISDAGGAGGAGGGGGGGGGDYDYVALNHAAVDGTENTGGGGGGGEPFTPGNRVRPGASGGSGVVIFAFDKNSITTIFTNTTQYQYYRFIYTTPATGTVLFKSINFTGRPTSPAFAISSTPNINDKINMNAYYGTTYKNSIVSNTVSF